MASRLLGIIDSSGKEFFASYLASIDTLLAWRMLRFVLRTGFIVAVARRTHSWSVFSYKNRNGSLAHFLTL